MSIYLYLRTTTRVPCGTYKRENYIKEKRNYFSSEKENKNTYNGMKDDFFFCCLILFFFFFPFVRVVRGEFPSLPYVLCYFS